MNIGLKKTLLRKQKGWSQTGLAKKIKVSLDYLAAEVQNAAFDKKILNRI